MFFRQNVGIFGLYGDSDNKMDKRSEKKKEQGAIMKIVEKEKPKGGGVKQELEAESSSASDFQQQTAVLNIYHIWILILFLLRGPKLGMFKLTRVHSNAFNFDDIVFEYT